MAIKDILNIFKKADPQKTFDTISSGVDKLFFTNEEKVEAAQKAWDEWLNWYKLNVDETSARSITRRILAIMFASVYLGLLLAAAVMYTCNPDYAAFLFQLSEKLFALVSGIMLFYFGYYGVKSIVETNKKNK